MDLVMIYAIGRPELGYERRKVALPEERNRLSELMNAFARKRGIQPQEVAARRIKQS